MHLEIERICFYVKVSLSLTYLKKICKFVLKKLRVIDFLVYSIAMRGTLLFYVNNDEINF